MKPVRASLRDLNRPHPLVAGPVAGLIAVALFVLFVPRGLDIAAAWGLFIAVSVGAGLGRLADERRRESVGANRE